VDTKQNNNPSPEDSQGNGPLESIFVDIETEAAKNIIDDGSKQNQDPQSFEVIGHIATTNTLNNDKSNEVAPATELSKPKESAKIFFTNFLNKINSLQVRNKPIFTQKRMAFVAIIVVVTALSLGGAVFNANKKPKAITLDSKISISGIDVSQQTPEAVQKKLVKMASEQKITLLINGKNLQATTAELGLERNIEQTLKDALKSERVLAEKIGLKEKTPLTYNLKTTVNKDKLNAFISAKLGEDLLAKDAQLVVENNSFIVKPGQTGLSINLTKLVNQINSTSLSSNPTINTDFSKINPEISDEVANVAKQQADNLVAANYSVGSPAIGAKTIGMSNKVKWVAINPDTKNKTIAVTLNKDVAMADFEAISKSFNRGAKNLVKVNIPGAPTVVLEGGYDGINIPQEEITKAKAEFVSALEKAQPASPNINPTIIPKTETVYDGQKKMVLIDLTRFTAYAIENSKTIKTVPITSGKPGFETPTGTFIVNRKITVSTMSACSNGECWKVPNIRWQSYFTGQGHAIHATTVVSSVGNYNVSHGCVGMYESDARWFFDWANPGTPVVNIR
jgi:lipoprotein-anchoring transpeptidase ErfK/SrfK